MIDKLRSMLDGKSDTSPSAPPLDERTLRKRIRTSERDAARARESITKHQENYKQHLLDGARSNSPGRRKVHAIRARFERVKSKVQEIKRMKAIKDLSQLTVAMEKAKIEEMVDDMQESTAVTEMLRDGAEVQGMIDGLVSDLEMDLLEMDGVMNSMDIDVGGIEMQTSEEEALMNSLAADEIDEADLDLDLDSLEMTAETDDYDFDEDFASL
jgi:hypothetical protein